jgi:hypothetical protein
MMAWATCRQQKKRSISKLDRSRTGCLVLTVSYSGDGFDAAIDQAIREHQLSGCTRLTVIAVPEGMT